MYGGEEHSLNDTISKNLRMLYALRKRNLEEFSSELGIGHTTLQNILNRKSNLTLDTVEVIAKRLNLPPLSLLSPQYPDTDLTCAFLLLETLNLFQNMTYQRRQEAVAMFCSLLELFAEGDPQNG